MKKQFDPIKDKSADIIETIMTSADMPQDDALLFKIRLAVEEVVENVVRYAYEQGNGWLEVSTEKNIDGAWLTIVLRDAGYQFNPLDKEDPDLTLSAEDRPIGGLGIFLCKQLMDNVNYKYEDNCNILTLQKKIS